jgi:hypothetical protein
MPRTLLKLSVSARLGFCSVQLPSPASPPLLFFLPTSFFYHCMGMFLSVLCFLPVLTCLLWGLLWALCLLCVSYGCCICHLFPVLYVGNVRSFSSHHTHTDKARRQRRVTETHTKIEDRADLVRWGGCDLAQQIRVCQQEAGRSGIKQVPSALLQC